jgi:hypothetical protein
VVGCHGLPSLPVVTPPAACTATGVPHLEAALRWEFEKSTLQLAVRQHGPASVIKAARRAQALGSSGDTPSCVLKVEVRELDSVEETLVQLGPEEPLVLQDLKMGVGVVCCCSSNSMRNCTSVRQRVISQHVWLPVDEVEPSYVMCATSSARFGEWHRKQAGAKSSLPCLVCSAGPRQPEPQEQEAADGDTEQAEARHDPE